MNVLIYEYVFGLVTLYVSMCVSAREGCMCLRVRVCVSRQIDERLDDTF